MPTAHVNGCEFYYEVAGSGTPLVFIHGETHGISRVMGGYHIQSDNIAGLELGRKVAEYEWPIIQEYFNGSAKVR